MFYFFLQNVYNKSLWVHNKKNKQLIIQNSCELKMNGKRKWEKSERANSLVSLINFENPPTKRTIISDCFQKYSTKIWRKTTKKCNILLKDSSSDNTKRRMNKLVAMRKNNLNAVVTFSYLVFVTWHLIRFYVFQSLENRVAHSKIAVLKRVSSIKI